MATQSSKYNISVNPAYQVDFATECKGKRVTQTKRTVRFRFGFSNAQAIVEGHTCNDCRGEEHEVVLIWSLTSGKRQLLMDDREIHFSKGGRTESKFETSWSIPGGHIMKLRVYAAPPLRHTPGFRQFDLLMDGCSYFDMPKIFELGTKRSTRLAGRSRAATRSINGESPHAFVLPPYTSPARVTPPSSPNDMKPVAPPAAVEADLLSLQSAPAPTTQYNHIDEFTPRAASYRDMSNQITTNYGPPTPAYVRPTVRALANEPQTCFQPATYAPNTQQDRYILPQIQYSPQPPVPSQQYWYQEPQYESSPAAAPVTPEPKTIVEYTPGNPVKLTMEKLSIAELEEREQPETLSPMEKAIRSLVNLDNIEEVKETALQAKTRAKKEAGEPNKSRPLAPTKVDWSLGTNASLSEIKAKAPPREPTREVMRTHVFDPAAAQAGMMVVYGATMQQPGFGVGFAPQPSSHMAQTSYYHAPHVMHG